MKEFGQYPIDAYLEKITAALQNGSSCLIKAEPGAGKTTRVPLHLLEHVQGEILVLEPRRLAARLSAERCAWFLDERCGAKVGFLISQDKKISADTRLIFITEGIFLRLLRTRPTLDGIGAVILDEFHERNIHTDIALVMVRRLQMEQRPDLKLVVMSATLETDLLENYLKDAAVFDIAGRNFPVDVAYLLEQNDRTDLESSVTDAVRRMLNDSRCPGNILVFLSGLSEITAVKRKLEQDLFDGKISILPLAVLPLAAGLSVSEQQLVFENGRKVVLSTNVAETSLTIPGITGVIDSGYAKIAAHAPWSGMPTLEIKRISQASAIQRAGRAGRTQRGLVFRLYGKPDFVSREPFTLPDIQRIDLSHVLLEVMNLGCKPDMMQWLEPPDHRNLESALQLLTFLGAVDGQGEITTLGRKLSVLPLHPRLAAVALAGFDLDYGRDALLAACLISEKFVLLPDGFLPDDQGELSDIAVQMDLLKAVVHRKGELSRLSSRLLDNRRKQRIIDLYRTLARKLKLPELPPDSKTDADKLSHCLLRGYPDRVAQRRDIVRKKGGKGGKAAAVMYNFCLGRGGVIGRGSVVYHLKPDFLVAVEAVESLKQDAARGVTIRACCALAESVLETDPGALMRIEQREEFDPKQGTVVMMQDRFYGKLRMAAKKMGDLGGDLTGALAENWPYPFDDDEALRVYHRKVELLDRFDIPHNCPVFSGEMLTLFFDCICEGITSLKELLQYSLEEHIRRQLSESDRAVLDAYLPFGLKLRNGKQLNVLYPPGKDPYGEIRLQDCFGLKETPTVLQGRLPVTLHLMGPGRRAAQITGDLAGFWKGAYKDVSKELSRRYPKHYWPADPAAAQPVRLKRLVD